MRMETVAAAALVAGLCLTAAGCKVDEHKDGNNENVKIATPFGGMSVKTNDTGSIDGLGLPVYPGAELVQKKDNGEKDHGSADVNMSFGKFQLRVKAVSYRTSDSPEKVQAFYRTALSKYGTVIDCVHNQPVGSPTQTPEGLTCDDNGKNKAIKADVNNGSKHELKTGSKQHQHVVGIDPEGTGTKFGLVALDLPGNISFGDDNDSGDKGKEKVQ